MSTRPRILVVDDEPDLRLALRSVLERAGFEVSEAVDGRDALRVFHRVPAQLVVLDVSMPELDGWQTLERLREISDVPVLMLTARAAEMDRVLGLELGADDYVTKPFSPRELVLRIKKLLARARSCASTSPVVWSSVVALLSASPRASWRCSPRSSRIPTSCSRRISCLAWPGRTPVT